MKTKHAAPAPMERDEKRYYEGDEVAIRNFLMDLYTYLHILKQPIPATIIPAGLSPAKRLADSHQEQHLGTHASRGGKSLFSANLATSPQNKVFNALMLCVHKLIYANYFDIKENMPPTLTANFVVDLGMNIGIDGRTKEPTSCIFIEGVNAEYFHIYPVSEDRAFQCTYIDAAEILRIKDYNEAKTIKRQQGESSSSPLSEKDNNAPTFALRMNPSKKN